MTCTAVSVSIEVEYAIAFSSRRRESFDHTSAVAMVLAALHDILLHHQELVLLDFEATICSGVRTVGQESTLRSLAGAAVDKELLRSGVMLRLAGAAVLSGRLRR